MSKTFVIGDIHGAYRALRQCLEKSGFGAEDHLISLGDVCDGWPETKLCVEELLNIKKLTYLMGNHDFWTYQWMTSGKADSIWLNQGGDATVKSYAGDIPEAHVNFFQNALPYFLLDNRLFVHAGIDPQRPLEDQDLNTFLWDRTLVQKAMDLYAKKINSKLTSFEEVYVGHTPILLKKPIQACDIWLMDTGAGWSGVLSMMNIHTKEVYTSDPVPQLYPGVEGRQTK